MILLRKAKEIYQSRGQIENGTFEGRWHFSFGDYHDARYLHFGSLRVFNDDTLSPAAIWPLHPHREIEVVTYCAEGEFRHADQRGKGQVLKKGWVQHTTVGKGMFHSEINNLADQPMRFIQMWFMPNQQNLEPSVEQKKVEKTERINRLLPLVSNEDQESLKIFADAKVYASFLEKGKRVTYKLKENQGVYLYILEGKGLAINNRIMHNLDAAMIKDEPEIVLEARGDTELLFIVVFLKPA